MLLVYASKMARFSNAPSDALLYISEIQICNVFSLSYTGEEFILLTVCVGIVLNELKKNYVRCTELSTLNWKMNMDCLWSK